MLEDSRGPEGMFSHLQQLYALDYFSSRMPKNLYIVTEKKNIL